MNKPERVTEGVYIIGGPQITDERDCCVYLIDGGTELALVDAGLGYSAQAIIENIKKLGLDNSLLKYVIVTHGHIDHVGGVHYFRERGAQVVCHELEYSAVSGENPELTAAWYYWVKYRHVPVGRLLNGDIQDVVGGNTVLHCLHTPGHTPGGIKFLPGCKGDQNFIWPGYPRAI